MFRADVEGQFKEQSPGPWAEERWPFETMEQALSVASSAHYDYPKRPNPKWTITLAHSAAVYRSEVSKAKAADNWKLMQDLKNRPTGRGKSRRADDED